jgi:DNA-binding NarL/FixJ family response regulator
MGVYKLKPKGRRTWTIRTLIPREDYGEVARLSAEGWTNYDIGARWGAKPATVANALRKWRRG